MKNKKERNRRGTLQFLSVKLLPVGNEKDYIEFFENLLEKDFAVRVGPERFVSFFNFLPLDSEKRIYAGRVVEYLSLDPDGYINVNDKKKITEPFESDGVGANSKETYFYFVPEAHRLAVFKNSKISLKKMQKFIQEAGDRLLTELNDTRELFVDIQKSQNMVEMLQNAYAVTTLKAKLSYSNKDLSKDFEKVFDNKLSDSGANQINLDLKTSKDGVLSFSKNSLPLSIVNIAKDNGTLEARMIEHEGDKPKKFNTEEHPREEILHFKDSTIGSTIYNTIMSIWRRKDETKN